ncbi:hypothetical protein BRADI_1g01795v3 [Brachypodium distachyon]|uniref:Uncharacterized protein n=1 Tax=Brachypodium distachyon TaxID=15368 RepID=A0A0Q3J2H4_BRADI|nr:hypothetical protein BRADI_1g01795v3 [Brachypodium distachyon]
MASPAPSSSPAPPPFLPPLVSHGNGAAMADQLATWRGKAQGGEALLLSDAPAPPSPSSPVRDGIDPGRRRTPPPLCAPLRRPSFSLATRHGKRRKEERRSSSPALRRRLSLLAGAGIGSGRRRTPPPPRVAALLLLSAPHSAAPPFPQRPGAGRRKEERALLLLSGAPAPPSPSSAVRDGVGPGRRRRLLD